VYGGVNNEVAVAPAEAPYVTVSRGQEGKVSLQGSFARKYLVAPVRKGQKVGDLVLMVDGKPRATIAVLTQASVTQGGLFKRFIDRVRMRLEISLWEPLRMFPVSSSSPFPRSEKAGAKRD
jgi:D-alanyl-D-alanine carboxypeptidase (penicillin-binding protein 5/6)